MFESFGSKLIIALIVVAAISFGLRSGDLVRQIENGPFSAQSGDFSEEKFSSLAEFLSRLDTAAGAGESAAPPPAAELSGPDDEGKKAQAPQDAAADTPAPSAEKPVIEPPSLEPPKNAEGWKGPEDVEDEYADMKMELFSDLAVRRKDLESKEKELAMREALLKAAQAELEQKTMELNNIKADIEALLVKQNEQESARIASLVKIYEGMKAKDAARIFDSLEIDVLLQVVTQMSERKSAPILAAMDPDKARNLTILLAEQNKLPSLPVLPDMGESAQDSQIP